MSNFSPPPPNPGSVPAGDVTAKSAKADAKAAKARAKALRPWYRKKRYWALAIVALLIVVVVASGGGDEETGGNSTDNEGEAAKDDGISQGAGSQDASSDVADLALGPEDSLGFRSVTLTVTNNSSKRSNYLIDVSIESPDGSTQYDTTIVFVNNLEPGQTTDSDAFPVTKEVPEDAVAVIKKVSRTAAN